MRIMTDSEYDNVLPWRPLKKVVPILESLRYDQAVDPNWTYRISPNYRSVRLGFSKVLE